MLKTLIAISGFYAANNTNAKEMKVLGFISENQIIRIKDIWEGTGIDKQYMTAILDSMEKKRLIKRVFSKEDRRVITPVITKEGASVWEEFENILSAPNG